MGTHFFGNIMPQLRRYRPFSRILRFLATLLVAAGIAGCGSERYESRLENTVEYYKYLERVQKALSPGVFSDSGLNFQPPIGFQLIPHDKSQGARDNRLPDFIRSEIPGIVGVWKTDVAVTSGGDEAERKPAYLMALSNAQRWAGARVVGAPEPLKYHTDLFYTLMGEVGISDLLRADKGPNLDLNVWKSNLDFPDNPKDAKFAPKKTYNIITLFNPDLRFDNMPMEFTLYQTGSGDNQAALLLITPRNTSPADNIKEKLKVALPTLTYTRPAGGQSPASEASNPAPARTGGF